MNSGKILLGVVIAVAAAVVVGMLIAPAKGSVTRKKLGRKGIGYAEEINDSYVDFTDTLSEEFESVKKSATDFVDKAKEKAASLTWAKHTK